MSCGCGDHESDEQKLEKYKDIPAPELPPMAPEILRVPEGEREAYRKKLQEMPREDVEKLDDRQFIYLMEWIMQYTSWLYMSTDHKIIMAIVSKDYPAWFEMFIERYGYPE